MSTRLPSVTYLLAAGTFLMGTTEFLMAGLLPGIAAGFGVSVARAGVSITVFAAGHVVGAVTSSIAVLLAARFLTALATGAFWAVASVVATTAAGPAASSRSTRHRPQGSSGRDAPRRLPAEPAAGQAGRCATHTSSTGHFRAQSAAARS